MSIRLELFFRSPRECIISILCIVVCVKVVYD